MPSAGFEVVVIDRMPARSIDTGFRSMRRGVLLADAGSALIGPNAPVNSRPGAQETLRYELSSPRDRRRLTVHKCAPDSDPTCAISFNGDRDDADAGQTQDDGESWFGNRHCRAGSG